jgi:hypothetical protein
MESSEVVVSCFHGAVPDFVGPELERLYGNTYSSLLQLETYGALKGAIHIYIARDAGRITCLLLFRIEHGRARILNEGMRLNTPELERFTAYVFSNYPAVSVISFYAVESDVEELIYPLQRFNCLEDIAMPLPATAEDYLATLGKNTRRNVKRYTERIQRAFPSFRFEVRERAAVREEHVRAIIGFNHARMQSKQKASDIDEMETQRILRMAQACGMVGTVSIDGRICAGTISYRTGDNYFLYVLAHDPAYDAYWIGILCCYLTIRECIQRGGKEFHFLWGRYEYKFTLGASERCLDRIVIYRSHLHMLLHAATALQAVCMGYTRRIKQRLHESVQSVQGSGGHTGASPLLTRVVQGLLMLQRLTVSCLQLRDRVLCRLGW